MVQIITISPIQRREESGEDESAGAGRPGDPAGHRERQLRERRRHLRRHQWGRSPAGTDRHLDPSPSLCLTEIKVKVRAGWIIRSWRYVALSPELAWGCKLLLCSVLNAWNIFLCNFDDNLASVWSHKMQQTKRPRQGQFIKPAFNQLTPKTPQHICVMYVCLVKIWFSMEVVVVSKKNKGSTSSTFFLSWVVQNHVKAWQR